MQYVHIAQQNRAAPKKAEKVGTSRTEGGERLPEIHNNQPRSPAQTVEETDL